MLQRQMPLLLMASLALVMNGCLGSGERRIVECTTTDSAGFEWRAKAPTGDQSEAEASVLDSCLAESKDPNSCQDASCTVIRSQ